MLILRVFLSLLLAFSVFFTPVTYAATSAFSDAQKTDIEKIVHHYLITHPEVLIEATRVLQEREQARVTQKAKSAIPQQATQLFDAKFSPAIGNEKADIVLVEFFDYQCGYCRQVSSLVKRFAENDKNLRVIFKEFPIFGNSSEFAAKAALAAQKQGKFSVFHEALMNGPAKLNEENVLDVAQKVGLNVKQLKQDMASPEVSAELAANTKLAEALGIMGTPAFVVAAYPFSTASKFFFVPGVPSDAMLKNLIQEARGKKST